MIFRNIAASEYSVPEVLGDLVKKVASKIPLMESKVRIGLAEIKTHSAILFG
jgi:hypothetical protein